MDFHDLQCFITASETLNFTKTAQKLYMTQQGVSRIINRLEDELVTKMGLDKGQNHFMRLERIRVNREPQEGEASLPGTIESREYYGLYIKYYIRCAGQIIKVIERNDGINLYDPGQQVTVGIHARNLMSYPRQ